MCLLLMHSMISLIKLGQRVVRYPCTHYRMCQPAERIPSHCSLGLLPAALQLDLAPDSSRSFTLEPDLIFYDSTFTSFRTTLPQNAMAEVAGLVIGAASLAGMLNNTLDCFEMVQLGRSFGKNVTTSQIKLDNARLRLARWGKSIGLEEDPVDSLQLVKHFGSNETFNHAKNLLGQVSTLFEEAEGVSSKYKSRAQPNDGSLAVYNAETDLDPSPAALHKQMQKLHIDRQNSSSLRKKAKWALFQEKQFKRLIEDITELVDNLVGLAPDSQQYQRQLADAEVAAVADNEAVSMLKEIAADQDKLLNEALSKAKVGSDKSHHITFSGSHNSGFQLGHNAGTLSGFTWGAAAST
jgi:hypothetical protein